MMQPLEPATRSVQRQVLLKNPNANIVAEKSRSNEDEDTETTYCASFTTAVYGNIEEGPVFDKEEKETSIGGMMLFWIAC